ncbi:MAG: phage Tail Collar domain protein, partial [Verrucomicrobiales bacterium]|nr:phage Tail Collar domain protein [Verrucomicrobiales bacterium]
GSATNEDFAPAASANGTLAPLAINGATGLAGGNIPFSIMQPFLAVNFIIALEGIFPSRN